MKQTIYLLFILCFVWACDAPNQSESVDTLALAEDTYDPGVEWLKSIFKCEEGYGHEFCYPNEDEVLTKSYYEYLIDANQFFTSALGASAGELSALQAEYDEKWSDKYPPLEEEMWAFGRGNGDIPYLENVVVEPLGDLEYMVDITYHEDFATVNKVKLIENGDGYLIDYVFTEIKDMMKILPKQEEGNVKTFTQKWTWTYKNELEDELTDLYKGTMSAYYNPETQNWLFTKESYGGSGEMVNWVVGEPDGTYTYSFMSVHQEDPNTLETFNADVNKPFDLEDFFSPLSNTKTFNSKGESGEIKGQEYERVFLKETIDKSKAFIAKYDANFAPLYHFNDVNSETNLLFKFLPLPNDLLYLEENSTIIGEKVELKFVGISKADKTIDITKP